jgi:antirestriction protein
MKHIQLFEEFVDESKSIKDHMAKAAEYKRDLMDLKKQAKTAKDPQSHQARIAAKEEQLRRVADVIRGLRAEGVREGDELTEAKDLRQLQRALDKLQNDYEAVLDDDALEALTQLIRSVNLKLK